MEFDKNKVYTAANADSLRTGSMGYHADNLEALKKKRELKSWSSRLER